MKLIFTVHTGKAKVIPLFYLYENHACKGVLGIKEKTSLNMWDKMTHKFMRVYCFVPSEESLSILFYVNTTFTAGAGVGI